MDIAKDFFRRQKAKSGMDLGDVVILDADNNRVTTPHDDLATFPSDIVSLLKKRLKNLQSDKISQLGEMNGDELPRAFLKALVGLIGGYRDALKFREGEQITFDREAFVQSRPPNMHQFLEKILHLQIFEEFINDRLELLNSGIGFSDEFEIEANDWNTDSAGKYNYWLSSMKKQGKKLKREGIEKLDGLKRKANPAMKSAVRNVKDKSKRAYKDLKSMIDDFKKPGSRSVSPRRPQTIVVTDVRNKNEPIHYKLISVDDINVGDRLQVCQETDHLAPERISFRLLEDPDIQSALRKSYSAEALCALQRRSSLGSVSLSEKSTASCSHAQSRFLVAQATNHSPECLEIPTITQEPTTPPRPRPPPPPRPPVPAPKETLLSQAAMAPPTAPTVAPPTAPALAPPIAAPRKRRNSKPNWKENNCDTPDGVNHLAALLDGARLMDKNQKVDDNHNSNPKVASIHDEHHGNVNRLKAAYMGLEEPEQRQTRIQRSQAFRTSTDRGITQKSFMEQFDPLSDGHDNINNVSLEDEDLLKDWSLDFSFMNHSCLNRRTPPTPPVAMSTTTFTPRANSSASLRNIARPIEAPPTVSSGTKQGLFEDLCDVRQVRCDLNIQKWEKFDN